MKFIQEEDGFCPRYSDVVAYLDADGDLVFKTTLLEEPAVAVMRHSNTAFPVAWVPSKATRLFRSGDKVQVEF